MRMIQSICAIVVLVLLSPLSIAELAKPSPAQYAWHEQERILFVCIGTATWMGKEYDLKGDFDLSKMNPAGLDAEEICRAPSNH